MTTRPSDLPTSPARYHVFPARLDEEARTMTLLCPRCGAELVTVTADPPYKKLPEKWWVCGCERGLQA